MAIHAFVGRHAASLDLRVGKPVMTTIHDGKIDRSRNLAGRIGHRRQRLADLGFRVALTMQLWSARHHHRQELAMMSDRDLKDARVARDLVAHEVRKWPWQKWHPQWQEMDEVLLRALAARRRRP